MTRAPARPAPAVALAVAAGVLTACSGTPQEEYCEEVRDRREALAEISDPAGFLDALPELEGLADAAPRDIADDWAVVVRRVGDLVETLESADVDPSTYDPTEPPEDLQDEEREEIVSVAQGLLDRESLRSIGEVEQHALDVCGVRLLDL